MSIDISEFLASMQPDGQSRSLARASRMGIPDADNDPNTKDAAGSQYAMRTDDLPDSENIDDRRDGNFDDTVTPENMVNLRPDGYYKEPGLGGLFATDGGDGDGVDEYAEGGLVDDEDDQEPDDQVTGSVTSPAIPDEEGFGGADDDQQSIDETGNLPAEGGDGDWRNGAMDALTKAIDYGYNKLHAANRPIDDDGSHEDSVRALLSGDGAASHDQVQAAQQAVDPEGKLDEPTRMLKTVGSLADFYKKRYGEGSEAPDDPASKAVWGVIQYARKAYNANAAASTAAIDNGRYESGAKLAQRALNQVPGVGAVTQVMWGQATPDQEQPQGDVPTPRPRPNPNANGGWQDVPSDVMEAPADKGRGLKARPTADGKFEVMVTDPERNAMLFEAKLSPEQLKHALAEGFDKVLHRGVPTQLGMASETKENHKSFGQRLAEANGLPPGMDASGLSMSQIGNMRQQWAAQQMKNAGPADIARMNNESRERISAGNNAGQERRTNINAGLDPDTRQARNNDPTGKQATFRSNQEKRAFDAAKVETEELTAKGQKVDREQVLNKWRKYYGVLPQPGQQGQQSSPAPQGNTGAPPAQSGEKIMNGWVYRADQANKQWVPVRKAQ